MSNLNNITKRTKAVVTDQLLHHQDKPQELTLETNVVNDLGADSLDRVELVMALEEEFALEIPDETAEKFETIGNVVDYLDQVRRGIK